jgi:hypothetical protein
VALVEGIGPLGLEVYGIAEHDGVRRFWRCRGLAVPHPPFKRASRWDRKVGYICFFNGIDAAGRVACIIPIDQIQYDTTVEPDGGGVRLMASKWAPWLACLFLDLDLRFQLSSVHPLPLSIRRPSQEAPRGEVLFSFCCFVFCPID